MCPLFYTRPATTEPYTLSLHDALPICIVDRKGATVAKLNPKLLMPGCKNPAKAEGHLEAFEHGFASFGVECEEWLDRKSTRLNSSHQIISYAVFCLKKKKQIGQPLDPV